MPEKNPVLAYACVMCDALVEVPNGAAPCKKCPKCGRDTVAPVWRPDLSKFTDLRMPAHLIQQIDADAIIEEALAAQAVPSCAYLHDVLEERVAFVDSEDTKTLSGLVDELSKRENAGPESAYKFARKIHDEQTAVIPYINKGEGIRIAPGSRELASEFDPPLNMLEVFHKYYPDRQPDGWAVLTGPGGYVVLDCETEEAFKVASELFPEALKTFGSKGGHVHLRVKGEVKRKQYKDAAGQLVFEVLVNWQVPLPGSIHRKTGKPYLLLQNGKPQKIDAEQLQEAVKKILEVIGVKKGELLAKNPNEEWAARRQDLHIFDSPVYQPKRFGFDFCELREIGEVAFRGTYIGDQKGHPEPLLVCENGEVIRQAFFPEYHLLFNDLPPPSKQFWSYGWKRKEIKAWLEAKGPCPDIKELYTRVLHYQKSHLHHPEEMVHEIVACYIVATHIWRAFDAFPRLLIHAKANSGKSQQLRAVRNLCFQPVASGDASKSSLFRMANATSGTILFDNFDNFKEEQKLDLMQFYEISYQGDLPIMRAEDGGRSVAKKVPTFYETYVPVVAATTDISPFTAAALSRSVVIVMEQAPDGISFEELPDDHPDAASDLIRKDLYAWGLKHVRQARADAKKATNSLRNRNAQIARPLLYVAGLVDATLPEKMENWLVKCFTSVQADEEFSEFGLVLRALHECIKDENTTEVKAHVKDVGKLLMGLLGIEETDNRNNKNPKYGPTLNAKCQKISAHLSAIPKGRKARDKDGTYYLFRRGMLMRYFDRFGLLDEDERQAAGLAQQHLHVDASGGLQNSVGV